MNADLHASITRIAQLADRPYDLESVPHDEWETGDYVCARVRRRPSSDVGVENPTGRYVELLEGETLIGALGTRRATRGLVGDWRDVGEDGHMHVLTGGGVLGRVTSASPFAESPIAVEYEGHVTLDEDVARMRDFRIESAEAALDTPVVVVFGTSMSAGKTISGRVITRVLVDAGYDVAATKLTGAGTWKDVLSMQVAGADPIYDFVDAGMPTTVVPESTYREAIRGLIGRIEDDDPDVLVVEIGASPLEPYNGEAAVDLLADQVEFTVLCATDPYAVVGIELAFGTSPDVVAGIATNTTAGVDLVEELTECRALNLQREDAKDPLREQLLAALSERLD